ncbi:hypothetical protein [Pseudoramibacter faecis]|uniref:hypothetical protein n=1 Tax=Pseudoramibacter faecis TaxID=3108534 RepID=UPI002E75F144|nr:hypothetical protein [Pseudoramibacter sp. HA2172]
MKMIVKKTSVFPAKQSNVFALLQRFDTLAYIAKPTQHSKAPKDKPNRFGKLAEVSLSILRCLASLRSVFMLSMSRNSIQTTFIQMRAIHFAPYGIIELFSRELLKAKPNIPTR